MLFILPRFIKEFLFFLLLSACITVNAQETMRTINGTKTRYKPEQLSYSKVPSGYTAVYINYVGRHGARHLTKDVKSTYAYKLIKKADSLHMLNVLGENLNKNISNLDKIEEKGFASISISGAEELKGIARRMYLNQKTVFTGSVVPLVLYTTKKGRTKESAEAFLEGLRTQKTDLLKNVKFNYADDDHLRFYDFSKAYNEFEETGSWKKYYEKLADMNRLKSITKRFSSQFFKPEFKLANEDQTTFTEDIFGFYAILDAIKSEIEKAGFTPDDLDFKKYFKSSELKSLQLLNDAEDFLKKGPGINNNGIQVKIAAPLLADFISTTDAYLKSGDVKADLRFAHAETIAPFAAIMDIKGASEPTKNIQNFNKIWQAEKVIPFSANIQWILYKNKTSGKYLIKFMLNEKDASINGLTSKTFPYYNWDSVRLYYLNKLKNLNLSLNDNMHEYLLKVK